jgi:hypothetical protein
MPRSKGTKQLNLDVPPELHEHLKRLAACEETTIKVQVLRALRAFLDVADSAAPKPRKARTRKS